MRLKPKPVAGYSIFGWFLLPGIRYPLWADDRAAKVPSTLNPRLKVRGLGFGV